MISDEACQAAPHGADHRRQGRRRHAEGRPTTRRPLGGERAAGQRDSTSWAWPTVRSAYRDRRHLRRRHLDLGRPRRRHDHRERHPGDRRRPHGDLAQHRPRQRRRHGRPDPPEDDMLVLNTQGAYDQNVRRSTLYGGDDLRPGDHGPSASPSAAPRWRRGRYSGNAGANSVGLFDSGVWTGTAWAPIVLTVLRTLVETTVLDRAALRLTLGHRRSRPATSSPPRSTASPGRPGVRPDADVHRRSGHRLRRGEHRPARRGNLLRHRRLRDRPDDDVVRGGRRRCRW